MQINHPAILTSGPTTAREPLSAAVCADFRLRHHPALDGLRGLACLMVMAVHTISNRFPGGFLGVDVFFVLSGFLITCLLLEEWKGQGGIDLKRFYVRRSLRLLPALLVLIAVSIAFSVAFLTDRELRAVCQQAAIVLCGQANRTDVCAGISFSVFDHAWSLSIEDKFYLVWPLGLCALLGQNNISRRALIGLVIIAVLGCIALRMNLYYVVDPPSYAFLYKDLTSRADSLLIGCLAGMLAAWNMLPRQEWFGAVMKMISIAVVCSLAYAMCQVSHRSASLYYGGFTLVAMGVAVLILTLTHWRIPLISWILEHRLLAWTGRLSYGLYLWHIPITMYAVLLHPRLHGGADFMDGPLGKTFYPTVIAMTYAAASLSYYCVERPLLKFKPSQSAYPTTAAAQASPGEAAYPSKRCA